MPVLDHQFTLNSGNALPYSWVPTGATAILSNAYEHNNKKYEVGLASLFIYITGGTSPPATVAVTHKYRFDRDGNFVGGANNVLSDITSSSSYSVALSAGTVAVFEARLDIQSWWKFSPHGGLFLLTPSGAGDLIINEMRVGGI